MQTALLVPALITRTTLHNRQTTSRSGPATRGEPARCARSVPRPVAFDQERAPGPDHPDTPRTRNNITCSPANAGESAAARDLFPRPRCPIKASPARITWTPRTRNNIAAFTGNAGEPAAARDLLRALLSDQERVLAPDHPDTLTIQNYRAWTGNAGGACRCIAIFSCALLPDMGARPRPRSPGHLGTRSNIAAGPVARASFLRA